MRKRTRAQSPAVEIQNIRERLVLLDGIAEALRDPNALLEVIMAADDPDAAISGLRSRFDLSETQAIAVLAQQFRRATRRDRDQIDQDRQELLEYLSQLESAKDDSSA